METSCGGGAHGGLAPYRLKRVLERIETGLGDHLSLERLSAEAGLNSTHFSRAFKQSLGVPPHRHLVRRRLERARGLLASTNLSILQVALEVGYGSHSHFATAFKKATGLTPREYRSVANGRWAWSAAARAAGSARCAGPPAAGTGRRAR